MFQGTGRYSAVLNTKSLYWPLINNTTISQEYYDNRWTPENQDAKYPRLSSQSNENNYQTNTLWLADRSFLKLRSIELYYKFPQIWVKKSKILSNAKIRKYNISKKEWVLEGKTVIYGSASELEATLNYDLESEKKFSYKGLDMQEIIHHLAVFVSRLWQIHIFAEGNTRTTAVFFIKYLRTLGFDVTNDIFAENAWYFRNALVRANYNDLTRGIHETTEYLEMFLRNLLLDEKNVLSNRAMHISGKFLDNEKSDIDNKKSDIKDEKSDIEAKLSDIDYEIGKNLKNHIIKLYNALDDGEIFGRSLVEKNTGLKASRASELIKTMYEMGLLESVKGHGKGKYRFKI